MTLQQKIVIKCFLLKIEFMPKQIDAYFIIIKISNYNKHTLMIKDRQVKYQHYILMSVRFVRLTD